VTWLQRLVECQVPAAANSRPYCGCCLYSNVSKVGKDTAVLTMCGSKHVYEDCRTFWNTAAPESKLLEIGGVVPSVQTVVASGGLVALCLLTTLLVTMRRS
jgi:hypothetical protein